MARHWRYRSIATLARTHSFKPVHALTQFILDLSAVRGAPRRWRGLHMEGHHKVPKAQNYLAVQRTVFHHFFRGLLLSKTDDLRPGKDFCRSCKSSLHWTSKRIRSHSVSNCCMMRRAVPPQEDLTVINSCAVRMRSIIWCRTIRAALLCGKGAATAAARIFSISARRMRPSEGSQPRCCKQVPTQPGTHRD